MADLDGQEQFQSVTTPGSGGLHTIVDPQDIDDTEIADLGNVVFTGGYVQPRQGMTQLFAKPSGETMPGNILARGTTSDGEDFLIAIYGTNFYLWDPVNKQTILLNTGNYTSFQSVPGPTGYQPFWSYETWLGGIGTDVMYFANGVDYTTKWQMGLSYPAFAAASGDAQILMPYPNRFGNGGSGQVIAVISGVPTILNYAAVDNVLTITAGSNASSLTVASSNSSQIVANPTPGVYTITFTVIPTANDTFTFTINGTAITTTAVNSIGSNPGNFLIASSIVGTIADLYNLLTNPSLTNTTQVAFSAPNQTLIGYCSYNTYMYNAITFSGTVGVNIPLGTAITAPIVQTSNVPVCSIVKSIQTRLWAVGGKGTESRISWSQTITPENFSTFHSNNTDPGTTVWGEGNGGVTGIIDGGGFIFFLKQNIIAQGQFIYSADASSTYLFSLVDFASGTDIGVSNFKRICKNQNNVDYLTNINGITELQNVIQSQSGTQTNEGASVSFSLLSEKINDRFQQPTAIYYFQYATALYYAQKSFWALSTVAGQQNNVLLMYDYLYDYWTVFNGWFVQDMVDYNNPTVSGQFSQPYFMSNADGSVNQFLTGTSDNGFAYKSYWNTKRFDFGDPAMPKSIDKVFVQGYIDNVTALQINVLYNENGYTKNLPFVIEGNSVYVLVPNPSGTIGADEIGAIEIGGIEEGSESPGSPAPFRVYLDCPDNVLFHNIQLQFSTNQTSATWKIDKFGFNVRKENGIPTTLILGPIGSTL